MASNQDLQLLDSWEELDTEVLEQNFQKLLEPNNKISGRSNGIASSSTRKPVRITLTGDDAHRSTPPEPTVKILKRPVKTVQHNCDSKVFQPKKTLQQREQEYAEARLRILGEASSEKNEERISIINKQKTEELVNVIRQPKGPDGTSGFKIRR
ncbi:SUZ domain-containing protein 1 [Harmonia axyridis]|uniref:SUZ domain-containing protein 1 n=1 Tax=Harmonia axyridis TaxID=115357 RepID=UPI001E2787F2|nr:SUZ domain-containing protein 1 [Harmonia axyridis]